MTAPTPRPLLDPGLLNGPGTLTRWSNLGYWNEPRSYPEAAAELARRVGRAVKLGPEDVVLDIACGFGDSCELWVKEFGVKRVVGVEPDPALVLEATARMKRLGLADRIVFRSDRAEWLIPSRVCPGVTVVMCIDASYFFNTRQSWLKALAADVPSGTRLGLADLCFGFHGRRNDSVLRAIDAAGIPRANCWTPHEIEPVLADNGWRSDKLVRCGPEVLSGFARHALRKLPRLAMNPGRGGWRALKVAAGIARFRGLAGLDYAIVGATRR